eukprot:6327927-Pyramimonas_sp.AAC.1
MRRIGFPARFPEVAVHRRLGQCPQSDIPLRVELRWLSQCIAQSTKLIRVIVPDPSVDSLLVSGELTCSKCPWHCAIPNSQGAYMRSMLRARQERP